MYLFHTVYLNRIIPGDGLVTSESKKTLRTSIFNIATFVGLQSRRAGFLRVKSRKSLRSGTPTLIYANVNI